MIVVTHYQRLLELHRARLRARAGRRPHRALRRQGAGPRAGGEGLRLARRARWRPGEPTHRGRSGRLPRRTSRRSRRTRARRGWLAALRRDGFARFAARGFPGPREEAWRHTNVAPIARTSFALPAPGRTVSDGAAAPARLRRRVHGLGARVRQRPLRAASCRRPPEPRACASAAWPTRCATTPERLQPHLARLAPPDETDPFRGLNAALLEDGGFVELSPGVAPTAPIHLVFFSTGEAGAPDRHASADAGGRGPRQPRDRRRDLRRRRRAARTSRTRSPRSWSRRARASTTTSCSARARARSTSRRWRWSWAATRRSRTTRSASAARWCASTSRPGSRARAATARCTASS